MPGKSDGMIDSPIAIPPEAGLEVGCQRPISHQDGLQVDWEAQRRHEAAIMQRQVVAELEGNRKLSKKYRRIMGLSILWFWVLMIVMVVLLSAGVGCGIAVGIEGKKKNDYDLEHDKSNSESEPSNITSPCQNNPYSNNTIIPSTSGQNIAPSNFLLFCNRTFDVDSSINLMQFAVPEAVANMNSCMVACLDYNIGGGARRSSDHLYNSCYAVTLSKNMTSGQQWCKLFAANAWGIDQIGADCAINLAPTIIASGITSKSSTTRASTTFADFSPRH